VETVLGMMAIPVLGLGIVAFAIWRDRSATSQIENAVPSTAVVRSIDETMQRIQTSMAGFNIVYKISMLVTPPGGGAPYAAVCRHDIPSEMVPYLQPGTTIRVLIDPKRRKRVLPDLSQAEPGDLQYQFSNAIAQAMGTPAGPNGPVTVVRRSNTGFGVSRGAPPVTNLGETPLQGALLSAAQLLATGTRGTALIKSVSPLGITVGQVSPGSDAATLNDPLWMFSAEIALPDRSPYTAAFGTRVPLEKTSIVTAGSLVNVAVDPADPGRRIAIDWHSSPLEGAVTF
jgi:hypothetical protein